MAFQNYGAQLPNGTTAVNMTAADVEQMFGAGVCADPQSRNCDLIPEAQDWLNGTNAQMAGGHCYGFSVLVDLLWQKKQSAAKYGASTVPGLQIDDNGSLQSQIAYDWALQTLTNVQSQRVTGTPNKILLTLIHGLKPDAAQAYTILIWKKDGTGGHAVTPYAVMSQGGGKYQVLIYDNNWPGQNRAISFDTKNDIWSYSAASNPNEPSALYEGNASTKTISLDPSTPGLGVQPCPFCGKVTAAGGATGTKANLDEVSLLGTTTSHTDLLITDSAGRKIGYVNGVFIDQIHGASDDPVISDQDWSDQVEPNIYVPADQPYTITLTGSGLTVPDTETINIIAPSYDLVVKNIKMESGEKDVLIVDPDATHLSYTSSRPETPTIDLGVSDNQADYTFEVSGVADRPGSTTNIALPAEGGTLTLQSVGAKVGSTVGFKATRETRQGSSDTFQHSGLSLTVGSTVQFDFGRWTNGSQGMPVTDTVNGVQASSVLENQAAS